MRSSDFILRLQKTIGDLNRVIGCDLPVTTVILADLGRNNCRGDGQQYRKPGPALRLLERL